MWQSAYRADPSGRDLADRHYNRQAIGADQFVPPGRCAVFYADTASGRALWVTSWPFPEFVKHAWPGAWICSAFRNEGAGLASVLVREAVAATWFELGDPPEIGMVTFIDRTRVRPFVTPRGREIFGQCFRQAGFIDAGITKGGLLALQLWPERMPAAASPLGLVVDLFA